VLRTRRTRRLQSRAQGTSCKCIRSTRVTPGASISCDENRDPRADFRGRLERAHGSAGCGAPGRDESQSRTVPRLYRKPPRRQLPALPGLLEDFKAAIRNLPTKSVLMVGLGETDDEILQVMRDLRAHGVDMLTIGSTCSPPAHLPVAATCTRRRSRCSSGGRRFSALPTLRSAPWCAPPTTPTGRRTQRA